MTLGRSLASIGRAVRITARRGIALGTCPVCGRRTAFYSVGAWPREDLRCARCRSSARWRALMWVIDSLFPHWRAAAIHESSPGGATSVRLARECDGYVASHFFEGVAGGAHVDGVRCEDLTAQTFGDASFDLVVTQDVLEHVFDVDRALAEIARTLRPGGAHVFTVPITGARRTTHRATRTGGVVAHVAPPVYHANPIDPRGSLVVTDWGADLPDVVAAACGMQTTRVSCRAPGRGIPDDHSDVFVSRKATSG